MNKLLIDANGLISFVTDRIPRQTVIMTELLSSAANLECSITVTASVLNDLVFVLEGIYQCDSRFIAGAVGDLLRLPGIEFDCGHYPEQVLKLWPRQIKEYGDAVLAAAAAELGLEVCTFDKRFFRTLQRCGLPSRLLS